MASGMMQDMEEISKTNIKTRLATKTVVVTMIS
jgi:hypothetical protein